MDNNLLKQLQDCDQMHIYEHWKNLDESKKKTFEADLNCFDIEERCKSFKSACDTAADCQKLDDLMEPLPHSVFQSISDCDLTSYKNEGLKLISEGKMSILLLAGGQGTRLGSPYPKGMFKVGLPSGKSLYQLQAERIIKLQELAAAQFNVDISKCIIPWYIMTSDHTRQMTENFFGENNYFNLSKNNVIFFEQYLSPSFTNDGKIIIEAPGKLSISPDGNGGLYKAVKNHHIVEDMEHRGLLYVHVYCVDNILVKIADPVFLGFCSTRNADCGAKVVEKQSPSEAVGVVCKVNGKYQVVEYSEITEKTAERRDEAPNDDKLLFRAGNIANHMFSVKFLRLVSYEHETKLPVHIARKKIPFMNEEGVTIKPTNPNGIKMEKFVFDVFEFANDNNFAVFDVKREDEFSPLKNADKPNSSEVVKDSPTSSRQALYAYHARLILQAGGLIKLDDTVIYSPDQLSGNSAANNPVNVVCEISPLTSYDGEGLKTLCKDKTFIPPILL